MELERKLTSSFLEILDRVEKSTSQDSIELGDWQNLTNEDLKASFLITPPELFSEEPDWSDEEAPEAS